MPLTLSLPFAIVLAGLWLNVEIPAGTPPGGDKIGGIMDPEKFRSLMGKSLTPLLEAQNYLTEAYIETAYHPVQAMRLLRQSALSLEGHPLDENFIEIVKEQHELGILLAVKIEQINLRRASMA